MSTAPAISPKLTRQFDTIVTRRRITLDAAQREEIFAFAAGAPDPLAALAAKLDELFPAPAPTPTAAADSTDQPPTLSPSDFLDQLASRLPADMILSPGEWCGLFTRPNGDDMDAARRAGKLEFIVLGGEFQRRDKDSSFLKTSKGTTGYAVGPFLAWLRDIPFVATELANVLATMDADEIEQALRDGEPDVWGASEATTAGHRWLAIATRVMHIRREKRYDADAAAKAPPPPARNLLIDSAMARLESARQAEIDAEEENRRRMLALYREILARRNEPQEADAQTLAEVCDGLQFTRADVERDIAALDRAAELERLADTRTVAERMRAMHDAGELAKQTIARHKRESQEVSQQLWFARNAHNIACAAPGDLRQLRREFSHLFAQ
jgi:hypothetical protein